MSIEEAMCKWESTSRQAGTQLKTLFNWTNEQKFTFSSKLYKAGEPFVKNKQIFDYGINPETQEPIIYPHHIFWN